MYEIFSRRKTPVSYNLGLQLRLHNIEYYLVKRLINNTMMMRRNKMINKKLKSIITLITTFCVLLTLFPTVSNAQVTTKISEYDAIKKYSDKTYEELIDMGFDSERANELLNLETTVMQKIEELKTYDDKTLRKLGYSERQIDALNTMKLDSQIASYSMESNETSIDIVPMGLFGDVYMSNIIDWSKTTSTKAYFDYSWYWDGRPLTTAIDGIGFAWDGGFRVSSSDIYGYVTYIDGYDSGTKAVVRDDVNIFAGAGWGHEFKMLTIPPSQGVGAWAQSGYGHYEITNPNNKSSIQIVWKYGHSTISIPSVGIAIVGAPSISFALTVEEMVEGDKIWTGLN